METGQLGYLLWHGHGRLRRGWTGQFLRALTAVGAATLAVGLATQELIRNAVSGVLVFTESVANASAGEPGQRVVPEVSLAHETDIERGPESLGEVIGSSGQVNVSEEQPAVVRVDHDPAHLTVGRPASTTSTGGSSSGQRSPTAA